jgi:probable F420-dependent oxidoreductase
MTEAPGKPDVGRFGVFRRQAMGLVTAEQAVEIERLGYGAVWAGGSPPAGLEFVEPILAATEKLTVATGIVNIWTAVAEPVAESYHRIEQAYPGRFLLGIGVGHAKHIDQYRKPCEALVEYLDELDSYGCRPIAGCLRRSVRGC